MLDTAKKLYRKLFPAANSDALRLAVSQTQNHSPRAYGYAFDDFGTCSLPDERLKIFAQK